MKLIADYIDIHTHFATSLKDSISVYNLSPGEALNKEGNYFSKGIHPWFIQPDQLKHELTLIEKLAETNKILAVGECGLDNLKCPYPALQKDVFYKQINIADCFNLPIIIHCVKAWSELFKVIKSSPKKVRFIIHGFNKNENILKELLDLNCYLSFGEHVMLEKSNAARIIPLVPTERLFLETDHQSDTSIKEIYSKVSTLIQVNETVLIDKIKNNFVQVFLNGRTE